MTGDVISASIAHEVKQPLTTIISGAGAGLNWLDRVDPDLNDVRNALRRVVAAGRRADAVLENVRSHFKMDARARTSIEIDDVIQQALSAVRDRLSKISRRRPTRP